MKKPSLKIIKTEAKQEPIPNPGCLKFCPLLVHRPIY